MKKEKIETGDPAAIPFWCFVAVLAWAPLPFASNTSWASNLLVVLIGLSAVVWAVFAIGRLDLIRIPLPRFRFLALVTIALIAWFVVQNAGWSPASWHHPMWQSTADTLDTEIAGAIGLDPAAAYETMGRIASYGLTFFISAQLCRRSETALKLAYALAVIAVVYALYGVIEHLAGLKMVAWAPKQHYLDSVTSTFVNRNSYGTFAGLGLIVVCGLLVRTMRRTSVHSLTGGGLSDMLDQLKPREFFLIGSFVLMAATLILTNSRGATLSTLMALIVFIILTASNQKKSRRLGTLIAGAIIIVGGWLVFSASSAGLVTRMLEFEEDLIGRREVAEISLHAIGERPILGYGLGSFEGVFQMFRNAALDPDIPAFDKAHNTYLEWVLEAGLPAALLMLFTVAAYALTCVRGSLTRQRNAMFPTVAASATTLVAIHALVDFSLQIPAVTVYYAAILGMGYAQSWSSRTDEERNGSTKPKAQGLEAWRSAAQM